MFLNTDYTAQLITTAAGLSCIFLARHTNMLGARISSPVVKGNSRRVFCSSHPLEGTASAKPAGFQAQGPAHIWSWEPEQRACCNPATHIPEPSETSSYAEAGMSGTNTSPK